MGDAQHDETYGGVGGVAAGQKDMKPSRWVGRCQKERCAMDLRVAREAARVAEKKLRDVGEVIESQVKGEVRRVQAELTTKEGLELAMVREIRLLKTQVEHYMQASKKWKNVGSGYEVEIEAMVEEIADLRTDLQAAKAALDAHATKQLVSARSEKKAADKQRELRLAERKILASVTADEKVKKAADKRVENANSRLEGAEELARISQQELQDATRSAAKAREDAMREVEASAQAVAVAQSAQQESDHAGTLLQRQLDRAARKVTDLASKVPEVPGGRTADAWAALRYEAMHSATRRERAYLLKFFKSHPFRASDIAHVLSQMAADDGSMLQQMFMSKELQTIHMASVDNIIKKMESEDFSMSFALFLHFELHLTLDKISRIVNAAGKVYKPALDRYERKVVLYHPHLKEYPHIKFPRLVPPTAKIQAALNNIYADLGCEPEENGRVAIKPVARCISEMLIYDVGKRGMPLLSQYTTGDLGLDIVFSADATGFGHQQFNTYGMNNPYTSKSAQNLRVIGLGNCDDGREGCRRVLGSNLEYINSLILADEKGERVEVDVDGTSASILPKVFMVDDVSKIRHGERLANSGWCGCSRNTALRVTPAKPAADCSLAELQTFLRACHSHSRVERFVLSHNTVPGESRPRPCTAQGCTFAHNQQQSQTEQDALLAEEAGYAHVVTKAGKAAFSKWRMGHAHSHSNVQPGAFGAPFLWHHFDRQILDPLHLAELGVPKTPWKHGILVNASDDARVAISDKLAEWRHPLDTRRKDDNRCRAQKWFTGEKWATFCAGKGGSPGGPVAIATLVLIIAEDLQKRGVTAGSELPEGGKPKGGKRSANLANFAASSSAATDADTTDSPSLTHELTAMELAADPADLKIIRDLYGSRAQTLINALLAFDSYFAWYYPLKESIPYLAPMAVKFPRALENCRSAIDMQEIFERLTIRKHGSFLPHGAVYKMSRDILEVGDIWAMDLSKLELQNADTKRTAATGGARNTTMRTAGVQLAPQRTKSEGPAQLVKTKGYSTSTALSVLRKLLGVSYLRQGDGLFSTPESRRKDRLFGDGGRTSRGRACKVKMLGADGGYKPQEDTCLRAFVRLLAHLAADSSTPQAP